MPTRSIEEWIVRTLDENRVIFATLGSCLDGHLVGRGAGCAAERDRIAAFVRANGPSTWDTTQVAAFISAQRNW